MAEADLKVRQTTATTIFIFIFFAVMFLFDALIAPFRKYQTSKSSEKAKSPGDEFILLTSYLHAPN